MTLPRKLLRVIGCPAARCGTAGFIGLSALSAHAQEAGSAQQYSLIPSVSVSQTFTDNALLTTDNKRFESITQLRPGIRWSSLSGNVTGSVDYSVTGVVHARETSADEVQQSLNAFVTVQAIANTAFIDARASISQQRISPLGVQSPDAALADNNRTEVSTLYVSPYVRGQLPGNLSYEARLNQTYSRSSASVTGDSDIAGGSVYVGSTGSGSRLGWALNYSKQKVDYTAGGKSETERLNGSLTYLVLPDLTVSITTGRELNVFGRGDEQRYDTYGWGLVWTPTERTTLSANREKRFFGSSYSVRFDHRMPRSVWSFSSSRSITGDQPDASNANRRTISVYDLLFQQFASLSPDPVQREALVNAFMRNFGIDRSALAVTGFVTSGASVDQKTELSLALIGLRSTLIVSVFSTAQRSVDPLLPVPGALGNGDEVRQTGLSANVSHRLTPESAVNLGLSYQKTRTALDNGRTVLKSISATWSGQLARRTSASLGMRRAMFDSALQPYTENAVYATVTTTF